MLKKILLTIIVLLSFNSTYSDGESKVGTSTDITSPAFTISVSDITPGGASLIDNNASITIENTLKKIIERLIIALGTIALLVMIIGAGFMILYAGDDERLSKGKNIFTGGLIAIAVALLSGLLVQLVAYLLYI